MYYIHLLPSAYGDAILIEYGTTEHPSYILMDGGPYYNFENLAAGIKRVTPSLRKLELLVVTHVDIDHIDGMVRLLNQEKLPFTVDEIWFNGFNQIKHLIPPDVLGYLQGDYLSMLIKDLNIPQNVQHFGGGAIAVSDYQNLPTFILPGGMEITLLSPGIDLLTRQAIDWENESKWINDLVGLRDKFEDDTRYSDLGVLGDEIDISDLQNAAEAPDKSLANESSIAFIGTYEGKSCLFAGDAPTDALLRAIKPLLIKRGEEKLKLNAWKVAHHGSKKSTLNAIMVKIDAGKLLISSDGAKYGHPSPETIAKLLKYAQGSLEFYFNYKTKFNERWDKDAYKKKYNYGTHYPAGEPGITVSL